MSCIVHRQQDCDTCPEKRARIGISWAPRCWEQATVEPPPPVTADELDEALTAIGLVPEAAE